MANNEKKADRKRKPLGYARPTFGKNSKEPSRAVYVTFKESELKKIDGFSFKEHTVPADVLKKLWLAKVEELIASGYQFPELN
jgi:hypothetical protein